MLGGPIACGSITSSQGDCIEGVGADVKLWSNRDYAFIDAPSDVLGGQWTYQRVNLDGDRPCGAEGGFDGTISEKANVAICCANHCGSENTPTGAGDWFEHAGSFAISQHGGEPCTFYETRLEAGDYKLCCSSCWASGAFFSTGDGSPPPQPPVEEFISLGVLPCDQIDSTHGECVEGIEAGANLWSNRNYAFTTGSSDLLGGLWTYQRVNMDGERPCGTEGGFSGTLSAPAKIALCCANHCGRENLPTGGGVWEQHAGVYALTNHGGEPCTFYQTSVDAGRIDICCSACWASGLFFSVLGR